MVTHYEIDWLESEQKVTAVRRDVSFEVRDDCYYRCDLPGGTRVYDRKAKGKEYTLGKDGH